MRIYPPSITPNTAGYLYFLISSGLRGAIVMDEQHRTILHGSRKVLQIISISGDLCSALT